MAESERERQKKKVRETGRDRQTVRERGSLTEG